jgi:hypothetical protein
MPELSRFFGLLIKIQYRDHNPPHVHVWYGGKDRAIIDISGAEILRGGLPRSQYALVAAWIYLHQQDLEDAWETSRAGKKPRKISPLRG